MNKIAKMVLVAAMVLLVSSVFISVQDGLDAEDTAVPAADETGVFQVTDSSGASVGSYDTLADAISNSKTRYTITMSEDSTTGPITSFATPTRLTIDLGGKTLTLSGGDDEVGFDLSSTIWTFKNGTIVDERDQSQGDGGYTTFKIWGSSTLEFNDVDLIICNAKESSGDNNVGIRVDQSATVNLTGGTTISVNEVNATGAEYSSIGVVVLGGNQYVSATLNVIDATIDVGQYGISGNGDSMDNTVINIQGGTVNAYNGWGIYHPQVGILNISGGTVSGLTGVEMRAGTLNMSGGTVKTLDTVESVTSTARGNGPTTTGVGIAVVQHTTEQAINCTITNGTVSGCNALYEANLQNNSDEAVSKIVFSISGGIFSSTTTDGTIINVDDLTGFVTGGTFNGNFDEMYITTGYSMNGGSVIVDDAKVTVTNDNGTRGFATFTEAIAAIQDGDKVTLLDSISTAPVTIDKSITLDLGGETLSIQAGDGTSSYGISFIAGTSEITNGKIDDIRGTWTGEGDLGYTVIGVSGASTELEITSAEINQTRPNTAVYNYGIKVYDAASLILGNGAKIYEKELETNESDTGTMGVAVYGPGGDFTGTPTKLTINEGAEIRVYIFGISGQGGTSGTQDYRNTVITVNGGTITGTAGMGIYHPQQGILNIAGGTISGNTGVEIRAGTINMTGGTVTGTGEPATVGPNGNGNTTSGVGIGISQHTSDLKISVNVSNGTVSGYHAVFGAFVNDASEDDKAKVSVDITGGNFSSTNGSETNIIYFPDKSGFVRAGTFTGTLDPDYVAPESIINKTDDGYSVVQRYEVAFTVTPSTADVAIVVIGPDGTEYQYGDGDLYLLNGKYTYTYTAEGYVSGNGSFIVNSDDVSVPINLIPEGTTVTVTLTYPDELGWSPRTVPVPYGGTLAVEQIPVEDGYVVNTYSTQIPESVTQDITLNVGVALEDPAIIDVTVTYGDGVAYITVNAQHTIDDAVLYYFLDPNDMKTDNVLTVSESGNYTVYVGAGYNGFWSLGVDELGITVEISSEPDPFPPFIPGDDDDVYIPPTVVVDQGQSDDDETVKIAACAAAAVAAAILAVLAIALYRKD